MSNQKKIRTNKDFFGAVFRRGLDKIPRANADHPLGEFLNHVVDSSKEQIDRELQPGDKAAIDAEGEKVDVSP